MTTTDRRYDIDWLRVIAIGLLLIYHIGIGFQPWGVFIQFIQNEKSLEFLWIPMTMLNVWRIPLLFFVSGMGVGFAIRKRNWKQLLLERTRRILIPFLFGIFFIVPIHLLIWQKYYHQDMVYSPSPGHLWFLGNIFIYVILLSPIFFYLKRNEDGFIIRWLKKLYSNPLGLLMIVVPFVLEALFIKPEIYEMYAMTLHGFLLGLLAFLFGFSCVQSGKAFWQTVLTWRWMFLGIAVLLYLLRLLEFQLKAPNYLMAVESNMWIFAVFGFAYKYLNHPSKTLSYLSQAAYPIYIIHMIFLYLGSFLIFPLGIPTLLKFILIVAFTGMGCFAFYDLVIRRAGFLKPLFGLKESKKEPTEYRFLGMKKSALIVLILALSGVSCSLESPGQYTYRPPDQMEDGLKTGTLDEVNLDARYLAEAVNEIKRGRYKEVHSILIFKDNKLVFEEYFKGHQYKWDGPGHHGEWVTFNRNMLHPIMSDTKSITSACIGIAIDQGYIESVHQSIFDYLPEHQHLNTDGKDQITIEHLLTMTSGLAWNEWNAPYSSPENDAIGIWFQEKDPITYILGRPLIHEPGTHFNYSGGNMIVLGEIIKNATQMKIDEFSWKYLFQPLGIDSANWTIRYPNGVIESAGSLVLKSRAMIKFGVTYLNEGVWNGRRIISEAWAEKSANAFQGNQGIRIPLEGSGKNGYSYSWWIHHFSHSGIRIRMFYAGGWGDQLIMVIPELNAVVVFTGGNYVSKRPAFKIFRKYVVQAFG